jgi:gliding motility-associated protein GldM
MGATNCPETPRQKMIAMMYLVYTALLALNVSVEILNGFVTVGDAMNESNKNIETQLYEAYDLFNQALAADSVKSVVYYDAAMKIKEYSDSLKNLIDDSRYGFLCFIQDKAEVVTHKDGKSSKRVIPLKNGETPLLDSARVALDLGGLTIIDKKDNTDMGTHYFYGNSDSPDGKAIDIKKAIIDYKAKVAAIFQDTNITHDTIEVNFGMNVEGEFWSQHAGHMVSWEEYNFDGAIAVADIVCLSRMKSELMNAEYDAIKKLFGMIGKEDFKFDQIAAICRPTSSYVIQGGKYEMKVNVGAYDSKRVFRAVINGQEYHSGPDGSITYTAGAGAPGERKVHGTVYMVKDGREEAYPFDESYFVAAPVAVIELSKMNVVYNGIDNPVTIGVPGVASRDVTATITTGNGTLTKAAGDGNYIIRPNKIGKMSIRVTAKIDGHVKDMGTKEYRVKRIPTPVLKIGNFKSNDNVSKAEIEANPQLRAVLEDFDFQIPAPKVASFEFSTSANPLPQQGRGSRLDPSMLSSIKGLKRGQKFYIDNVKVTTPDGVSHSLTLTLRMK